MLLLAHSSPDFKFHLERVFRRFSTLYKICVCRKQDIIDRFPPFSFHPILLKCTFKPIRMYFYMISYSIGAGVTTYMGSNILYRFHRMDH